MNWLEAHPVFYSMFFLPLALAFIGAVVNAFTRKRTPEEYAAMPQRLAGFLRLMSALFPDSRKAIDACTQIVKNAPPANPTVSMKRPMPTVKDADPPATDAPLVLMLFAIGAVLAATPYALCSCSPAANRTAQAEAQVDLEVTSYTAEVTKCRLDARASFDACMAADGGKPDCKQRALMSFDSCACGVDAKYKHDAGGSCK